MSGSADNVLVAVTGALYRAPLGTPLPVDASTPIDEVSPAYDELGYVSEDGVTEGESVTRNNIKAWQNGTVVRKVQTEHDETFVFELIETSPEVLEAYYGNYAAGSVEVNAATPVPSIWVIDVIDGDQLVRIVVPYGEVTDKGDITYANTDAIGYPLTITAYEDPDYDGAESTPAKAYKHFATLATTGGS